MIFLIFMLIISSFLSLPQNYDFLSNRRVRASSFEGEDILKGVGIAIVLMTATQLFLRNRTEEDKEKETIEKEYLSESYQRHENYKDSPFEMISDDSERKKLLALKEEKNIKSKEIEKLAHLVHGESRGEPFNGQIAVAAVVFNRKKSNNFPDTITQVIYQTNQFTAVKDGQYLKSPDRDSYKAVFEALAGRDPSQGAHYFYNPKTADNMSFFNSLKKVTRIGNHIFAIKP